jgi:dCMP deaminase
MNKVPPRVVPDRDEFYLAMAFWAASRSKDRETQCGSVIVSFDNLPLGWGYNGPPKKIKDVDINWVRPHKYLTMVHSEVNAIKHSCGDTRGATLYCTGRPCPSCMLAIVTAEISRVVWFPITPTDGGSMLANPEMAAQSEEIARLGGVRVEEYPRKLNWMRDRIKWMEQVGVFG